MNALTRTLMVGLVLAATSAVGNVATADVPVLNPYVNPGVAPQPPRLGFNYTLIPGFGYRVDCVWLGSAASLIGLEPGDIVRSINGFPLTYDGAHTWPLQQAAYRGGWVLLGIRDVRTGRLLYRWGNLNRRGGVYPF